MRRRLALAAVLAAGLAAGVVLGTSGPAFAFPHVCSGTACHGSKTDSFGDVCAAGATTYWEDSNIPSNAIDPHVTSFSVTPKPPCTGATVSAPTVDKWPASNTDPDGKPAQPKAGESTFRIRWTVTVPAGSKPVGSMDVAWSIAWTEPAGGGGSDTVTASTATSKKYDLEAQILTPDYVAAAKAPHGVEIKVVVINNGPAPSPGAELHVEGWVYSFKSSQFLLGSDLPLIPTRACPGNREATCVVHGLDPGREESFLLTILWSTRARAAFRAQTPKGVVLTVHPHAWVVAGACKVEETNCVNNDTEEDIPVR